VTSVTTACEPEGVTASVATGRIPVVIILCRLCSEVVCSGGHLLVVLQDDMAETQEWLASPSLKDSWQAWNKEWVDVLSNASGKQMGRLATCLRAHLVKLPMVLLLIGAVYRFDVRQGLPVQKFAIMLAVSGEPVVVLRNSAPASARTCWPGEGIRLMIACELTCVRELFEHQRCSGPSNPVLALP